MISEKARSYMIDGIYIYELRDLGNISPMGSVLYIYHTLTCLDRICVI